MPTDVIDIHPHIVSDDEVRYPRAVSSAELPAWGRGHAVTVEMMAAAMDQAGVGKAAIVQAGSSYRYDNRYLVDAIAKYPGRFVGIGSIQMKAADAPGLIHALARQGVVGFRFFLNDGVTGVHADELDDPLLRRAMESVAELGLPLCIQPDTHRLPEIATLAAALPRAQFLLDHLGLPDLTDGPEFKASAPLFALAKHRNVALKISTRNFLEMKKTAPRPQAFIARLVEAFGASRLAWASNYPASPGTLVEQVALARDCLSGLSEADRGWIFARTAQALFPALADR